MNDMQEIITIEQANRLFLILAIAGPVLGLVLGAIAGGKRGQLKLGSLKGLGIGLGGTVVLVLWKIYNAITDRLGLDTVKNLVVNLIFFIGLGIVAGLFAGRYARNRMSPGGHGPDDAGGPGGSLVGATISGGPKSSSPGEGRSPEESLTPDRDM